MSVVSEFKEFAVKGNVVDMAVGVIIGAAFGRIVTSFVADVVTPPLGLLMGGAGFVHLQIVLKEATGDTPGVVIAYGKFLQAAFDFLIVAFAIFLAIRAVNRLRRQEPAPPPATPEPTPTERLLGEIRDALRGKASE